MKRGTRPTRAQKILIASKKFSPANWLVTDESKESLTIVHKQTKTVKTLKKLG